MQTIRAGRIFDGERVIEETVVRVESGLIAGFGGGEPDLDLGDEVTLLPGLIDSHIHLVFDAKPDLVPRLIASDDATLLEGARTAALLALSAGITTVRDLGDRAYVTLALREEFEAKPGSGPEILSAGPPITTPRGHCWYLGGETTGADGVRAAVRERAERGVHVIKVMASGGEITPGTFPHIAQFSLDELRAAVEEAHRFGLPVTAHAHGASGIANAVAAGVDSIEHCSFLTEDSSELDRDVLSALLAADVTVSATIGRVPGISPPPRIAALLGKLVATFQAIRASGARIVASSDAGIGPAKPHNVLPYAPQQLVEELGFPPAEALNAVTAAAADHCRVGDRKGRIATGYDADLLAVYGDPTTDIAALLDVAAVFRAGHRVR